MKFNKSMKLLVIFAMISTMFISSISTISAAAPVMLGYYTGDTASDNALHANYSYMTDMSTDTFNATTTGNIVGTTPTSAITFANSKNIKTYACISNFGTTDFDPALAHAVLTNATAKNNLITNLVNLVQNNGYKGVNVDFEAVLKTDRTAYSNFMGDLANSLRPLGYKTLISAPATTNGDPNDDWSGAFDYASLGQNVDYIQVMTYDQNGPWSAPGPVAGKDWMEQSLQYAVSVVPPAKVLMGLPAYGYDWNLTAGGGAQVAWTAIPALISSTHAVPQYDTATASPHFTYTASNGQSHVVWYENAQSVTAKSAFYNTYHLGGISMWAIGLEDASFWQAVKAAVPTPTPTPTPIPTPIPTPNGAAIPGKIEAESYSAMFGVVNETTTDTGGGVDVGYIDPGDWMDYKINVQTAGSYTVGFRVASPVTGGQFQLKNSSGSVLGSLTIPNTGGYQIWQTANLNITLPAGSQTIRIYLVTGEPNLNWLNFTTSSSPTPTPTATPAPTPTPTPNGAAVPGKIEAESYSAMSGVVNETTTDKGGGVDVGYIDPGDWMDYKINVQTAGNYKLEFRVASPVTGGQFQLKNSSGAVLGSMTIPNTGGYQIWQTANLNITLPAGNQTIRVYLVTGEPNLNWLNFIKIP